MLIISIGTVKRFTLRIYLKDRPAEYEGLNLAILRYTFRMAEPMDESQPLLPRRTMEEVPVPPVDLLLTAPGGRMFVDQWGNEWYRVTKILLIKY